MDSYTESMFAPPETPLLPAPQTELVPAAPMNPAVISGKLELAILVAEKYASMSTAKNTRIAFASDWKHFEA
jgi:hypothetical protein